jgi:hypothetical protein
MESLSWLSTKRSDELDVPATAAQAPKKKAPPEGTERGFPNPFGEVREEGG